MSDVVRLSKAERQCIKIALMHMATELSKLGYKWDPRLRDAFCHGYDAVREPGEPSVRRMFRDARPDELPVQDIADRMKNQGFILPPSAANGPLTTL